MTAQQQDAEDLVDHHKRFVSLSEIVDRAHGKIALVAVAKENVTSHGKDPSRTLLAEKNECWLICSWMGLTRRSLADC